MRGSSQDTGGTAIDAPYRSHSAHRRGGANGLVDIFSDAFRDTLLANNIALESGDSTPPPRTLMGLVPKEVRRGLLLPITVCLRYELAVEQALIVIVGGRCCPRVRGTDSRLWHRKMGNVGSDEVTVLWRASS